MGNRDDMIIGKHGDFVRRVKRGQRIVVQRLREGQWVDQWSTDEMNNDFAYTESRRVALYEQREAEKEEA
jgi:hypothetical protein